jgi:hypothetical protein
MTQAYNETRDPFSKIGSSDPSESGVYPEAGVYPLLFVDSLKMIQSRKGDDLFIAEFDIVQSEVDTRRPGTRMSWVANLSKHDAAPGNVKLFLATLMDVPLDQVDSDGAKFACSTDNPCRGRLIRLEASTIKTKAGGDFTRCSWRSVSKEVQAQSEELRQKAGFTPF